MTINNIAKNDQNVKLNHGNFDLNTVAESLVEDIDVSVKRDFIILSETLNKKSKSALDTFFSKMDKDALNHELTMMKQKIDEDENDVFWEDYLHPFKHLTQS